MSTRHLQKGYSLLELVIYIGLFALLSVVLMQSLVSVVRTYAAAARYRTLQTNGTFVMERLTRDVRSGATLATSTCATALGTLTVTDHDGHTSAFAASNGALTLALDGGLAEQISSEDVAVDAFTVCPLTTPVGSGAKVTLTLRTTGATAITASFYTTTMTRAQ